jgi:hypothetical protein
MKIFQAFLMIIANISVKIAIQKKITYRVYNSLEFQIQKADLLANAHLHLFGEA